MEQSYHRTKPIRLDLSLIKIFNSIIIDSENCHDYMHITLFDEQQLLIN